MERPRVGEWYFDEQNDQRMEVIESKEDYLILQTAGGGLQEYSMDEWEQLDFEPIAASDDWEFSWHLEEHLDEIDERYDPHAKKHLRNLKEKEEDQEEIDVLAFSDDLEESHDFDSQ